MIIKEKFERIYNQLLIILFQLNSICVSKLSLLPNQIEKIVVGENKIGLFVEGLLEEINSNDLNGVLSLEKHWFENNINLTNVIIPNGIHVKEGIFQNCINLKSITIPYIPVGWTFGILFQPKCLWPEQSKYIPSSLKSVELTGDATFIDNNAFYGCTSLESITISGSVTSIRNNAFAGCTSLTNITIPDSVTSIGSGVFYSCTSLTDIYCNSTIPPSLGNTSSIPSITTIHVPIGSGNAYKSATNWSYHSERIVEDIVIESGTNNEGVEK